MYFHEHLVALMKERGLRPAELARRAGISKAALSLILRGKSFPQKETLQKLNQALGTAFSVREVPEDTQPKRLGAYVRRFMMPFSEQLRLANENSLLIPLVAMGTKGSVPEIKDDGHFSGTVTDAIAVPPDIGWGPGCYALKIRGEDMSPALPAGSVVLVNPIDEAKEGDLAVLRDPKSGSVHVRELTKVTPTAVVLLAYNPSFPLLVYKPKDLRFQSKVIWIRRGGR